MNRKLKASRRPRVLTAANQAALDRLEHAETLAALKQGLAEADRGETIPFETALERLLKQRGVSS